MFKLRDLSKGRAFNEQLLSLTEIFIFLIKLYYQQTKNYSYAYSTTTNARC